MDNVAELKAGESHEPVAKFLKTRLVELSPGHAKVSIRVGAEHLNFNGLVFGGIIMAVADEAFASPQFVILPATPRIAFISLADGRERRAYRRVPGLEIGATGGDLEMVTNQDGRLVRPGDSRSSLMLVGMTMTAVESYGSARRHWRCLTHLLRSW
jgi:hypothetical protein